MGNHTIINLYQERERVSLPAPQWEGETNWGTGTKLTAIFYGSRTGRMFMETYSIWENHRTHGVVGETTVEITESEYLTACNRADIEPKTVAVEI